MGELVWVDAWQVQCCGDPFEVGATVEWETSPEVDRDWLRDVLGPEVADEVTLTQDHHDVVDGPTRATVGTVARIEAVTSRLHPEGGVLVPTPGSGRRESLDSADGWEHEPAGWSCHGYLVHLE